MLFFFFSSKIRNPEVPSADDVAILEDCIDFSLAKTISKIEEKLEKGDLPDCLDDDIIPSVGNEIGAGRFPPMAKYFYSYFLTVTNWFYWGEKVRVSVLVTGKALKPLS